MDALIYWCIQWLITDTLYITNLSTTTPFTNQNNCRRVVKRLQITASLRMFLSLCLSACRPLPMLGSSRCNVVTAQGSLTLLYFKQPDLQRGSLKGHNRESETKYTTNRHWWDEVGRWESRKMKPSRDSLSPPRGPVSGVMRCTLYWVMGFMALEPGSGVMAVSVLLYAVPRAPIAHTAFGPTTHRGAGWA